MGFLIVRGFVTLVGGTMGLRNEIEIPGIAVGFAMLVLLRLAVLVGAAVIAFLLKKSFIIEKAPTTWSSSEGKNRPARGWLPWVAAAGFLVIVFVSFGYTTGKFFSVHSGEATTEFDVTNVGLQPKQRVTRILGRPVKEDDPRPGHDTYSWGLVNYKFALAI